MPSSPLAGADSLGSEAQSSGRKAFRLVRKAPSLAGKPRNLVGKPFSLAGRAPSLARTPRNLVRKGVALPAKLWSLARKPRNLVRKAFCLAREDEVLCGRSTGLRTQADDGHCYCQYQPPSRKSDTSGTMPAWRAENATLSRYITRPAIANERLTLNRAGDVVLQLKSPYHDGTHVVMSPLELMQRLAALVPRPRLHLIRFHGVLAPNAKLRSAIIPSALVNALTLQRFILYLLKAGLPARPVHADAPHPSAPVRLSFAQLLKRVFDIDIAQCPRVAAVP